MPILNVKKPLRNLNNIALEYDKMQENVFEQNMLIDVWNNWNPIKIPFTNSIYMDITAEELKHLVFNNICLVHNIQSKKKTLEVKLIL